MEANAADEVGAFLGDKNSTCIKVPRYQRSYVWEIEQAHGLIRDVAEAITSNNHWIGVVIWRKAEKKDRCEFAGTGDYHTCKEIIDGQQRLTTLRLWQRAILDHAELIGKPFKFRGPGGPRFYLQDGDSDELENIENGTVGIHAEPGQRLTKVYLYFRMILWLGEDAILDYEPTPLPNRKTKASSLEDLWTKHIKNPRNTVSRSSPTDLQSLLESTSEHLTFLTLRIDPRDGDATEVFDALNGNRTELDQFDHLRNYVFSKCASQNQKSLFDDAWIPIERILKEARTRSQRQKTSASQKFFYEYMISVGIGAKFKFNQNRAFAAYRRYENSPDYRHKTVEEWVKNELVAIVHQYCFAVDPAYVAKDLRPGHGFRRESLSTSSKRALARINIITKGPATPLLMLLLARLELDPAHPKHINKEDFERCAIALEGSLFKVLLSGQSLTNFRAWVINSIKSLDDSCKADATGSAASKLENEIRKISKDENWRSLRNLLDNDWKNQTPNNPKGVYRDLGSAETLALFDAIEEQESGPRSTDFIDYQNISNDHPYSIDHIFPQNPGNKWTADLKTWKQPDAQMRKQVHRLGNLAPVLSTVNKKMKNRPLADKIAICKKEKIPMLKTGDWTAQTKWTQNELDDRTDKLIKTMEKRWPD